MISALTPPAARRRAIRLWLLAVAALMVLTLVVGGATRLTAEQSEMARRSALVR